MMSVDKLDVAVTFDAICGYIGSAPELREPVVALSLGGLRQRIEALMLPDDVHVVLHLDRAARRERDRRRQQAQTGAAGSGFSPATMALRGSHGWRVSSASTPENPDHPWFFSESATGSRGKSPWGRALGRSRVLSLRGGGPCCSNIVRLIWGGLIPTWGNTSPLGGKSKCRNCNR